MLSKEKNEVLTRVGAGTPVGDLLRLYWLPSLPSDDLMAGAKPTRIRLLGEDLVAYRSPGGVPGVVAARCPHRGAPMSYARNEECGLRCIYHGWQFEPGGHVHRDAQRGAREPAHRLHRNHRLSLSADGVVWVYMGPDAEPPGLPEFEWNRVPAEQVHISLRVQHATGSRPSKARSTRATPRSCMDV